MAYCIKKPDVITQLWKKNLRNVFTANNLNFEDPNHHFHKVSPCLPCCSTVVIIHGKVLSKVRSTAAHGRDCEALLLNWERSHLEVLSLKGRIFTTGFPSLPLSHFTRWNWNAAQGRLWETRKDGSYLGTIVLYPD